MNAKEKLAEELSLDPHNLMKQLSVVDAIYYTITERLNVSKLRLTEAINTNQLLKSKELTEADRKNHVAFKVRNEQLVVDNLEEMKTAIKQKVSLGQSILGNLKEERRQSGNSASL